MSEKINVGLPTEDDIQAALEGAFSADFVFRSPKRDDGKELCDLLVVFEGFCLVVQAKAQAVALEGDRHRGSLNWPRKHLRKAGRQIDGAARALKKGRIQKTVNERRGEVALRLNEIKSTFGLIVINHDSVPYDPFELTEALGSLRVPLNVISFCDFQVLAGVLDTPADLIRYLDTRCRVLIERCSPRVHQEKLVFQYWLDHIVDTDRELRGGLASAPGIGRGVRDLRALLCGEIEDAGVGRIVDDFISRLHSELTELRSLRLDQIVFGDAETDYLPVALELGKIPRVRRIRLGRRFFQVLKDAAKEGEDRDFASYSPARSDGLVFLASVESQEGRSERRAKLACLTLLYKHYRGVRKVVGIATEAGLGSGRSLDVLLLDFEHEEEEGLAADAEQLFGNQTRSLWEDVEEF